MLCEIAIIACDLAEVIGTAIALQLLFGIPLVWGVCLTALDVLLILVLQQHGFRKLEAFIVALLIIIAGCFAFELAFSQPEPRRRSPRGLVPRAEIVTNPAMLYIAIGILGATVMPHNLYLHSSIVQTRRFDRERARQARGDPLRHHRQQHRAQPRLVHQRLDPDPRRRDLPRRRAHRRRRNPGRL